MAQINSSLSVATEFSANDGGFPPASYRTHIPLFGRFVALDGVNLFYSEERIPRLANCLCAFLEVARVARNGCCYFDASARFHLTEAGQFEDLRAYNYLLRNFPAYFVAVRAGEQADAAILRNAHKHSGLVVSNDKFRDYQDEYPWVSEEGQVLRAYRHGEHLHFNDHRLFVHDDLHIQIRELESLL